MPPPSSPGTAPWPSSAICRSRAWRNKVRAVFGTVPGRAAARPAEAERSKLLEKDVDIREEMDVKEAYLAIGFVGPDYNHEDRFAVDLLVEILGRGINPMLNSALRARRDLVQTVSMSYVPLKSGGIVMAVFTLDPKDVRMARSEALGFLRRAREPELRRERSFRRGQDLCL